MPKKHSQSRRVHKAARRSYGKVDWVYAGLVVLILAVILALAYELYLAR